MLLVHGLIHLLGYDHETDEDFEAMVAVEQRVLEAIRAGQAAASTAGNQMGQQRYQSESLRGSG